MQRNTIAQVKMADEYKTYWVRLILHAFALIYCLLGIWTEQLTIDLSFFWIMNVSFMILTQIQYADLFRKLISIRRRYIFLFIDISYTTLTIAMLGGESYIFWMFYIWLFVGYGTRYGQNYLFAAQRIVIVQYGALVTLMGLWQQNTLELMAQFIFLIAFPAYILSIVNRIHDSQKESEKLARLKSNFLTSMSHEIRTPLNGIIGTSLLLNNTEMNGRQKKYAEALLSSSELLLVLINNILDIAKIEANKFSLNEDVINLKHEAERVMNSFIYYTTVKNLEITLDFDHQIPEQLIGDKQRINQVLINLVGNAVKYTEEGSIQLVLKLSKSTHSDEEILLEGQVIDTGIGIEPEDQANVFEKYTQFANAINSPKDNILTRSGLGLAITKDLIGRMHGTIDLESEPNVGTTFTFTLPFRLDSDNHADKEKQLEREPESHKLPMLIVEDDDINALIMSQFLTDQEHLSERAPDGESALKMLENEQFSIIFMDLNMPGISGIETTEKLREKEIITPVVGLTANATDEQKADCFKKGMNDFITKPITPDDLKIVIEKHVDRDC